MKVFEIEGLGASLNDTDLANIFNVYDNDQLCNHEKVFNINRTFNIKGSNNASNSLVERYMIKADDDWASISYKYYGTNRLWWLICKVNEIHDPTVDPVEGEDIYLLKEDFIYSILKFIKEN